MQLSTVISKSHFSSRTVTAPEKSAELSVAPVSAMPPVSQGAREERLAIFEMAEQADQDFENAKLVADAMLQARSQVIEKILVRFGKGPFSYKGQQVRIVKRKSDDGKRLIFFFRAISRFEVEEID